MGIFKSLQRKDWVWVAILTLIGLFPTVFLMIYGNDLRGFFLKSAVYFIISVLLFFAPSLFLKARTFFLVQGIFVLFSPVEVVHIYMNGVPVTKAFFVTVLNTSFGEATELLSSFIPLIIIYILVYIAYFYIAIRKIDNAYFLQPLKLRLSLLGAVAILLVAGYGYYYTFHTGTLTDKTDRRKETTRIYKWKFNKIYPYSFIFNLEYAIKEKIEINKSREKLKTVFLEAEKKEEQTENEVYILVIGETARYKNFSVNGYYRPTTPLLDDTENLITYSDFMSEASLTILSLPILLTDVSANDFKHYYEKKSFVDAFKEAGFTTYWFANQSAENGFVRRIASDTDGDFFSTIDYDADNSYDELLFPYLDEALSKGVKKTFIVLHTLGSHFKYNFRYPAEFNVFRPSVEGNFEASFQNPKNKEILINTYDNSILYTDYFLANTIRRLDSLNCISAMIYVSDHGENIYDTEDNIILHGGKNTTRYDYHVPLFFWYSDKYESAYSNKVENLKEHRNNKLSMSYLYSTILDMADITYKNEDLSKSMASDQLVVDSVRYVLHSDYMVYPLPD